MGERRRKAQSVMVCAARARSTSKLGLRLKGTMFSLSCSHLLALNKRSKLGTKHCTLAITFTEFSLHHGKREGNVDSVTSGSLLRRRKVLMSINKVYCYPEL